MKNSDFQPVVSGLDYLILRTSSLLQKENVNHKQLASGDFYTKVTLLRDCFAHGNFKDIIDALDSLTMLRNHGSLSVEIQENIETLLPLDEAIRVYEKDKDTACSLFNDFWLKQQHFWHTRTFIFAEKTGTTIQRKNWEKATFYGFRQLSIFHVVFMFVSILLFFSFVFTAKVTNVDWLMWFFYPAYLAIALFVYRKLSSRHIYELKGIFLSVLVALIIPALFIMPALLLDSEILMEIVGVAQISVLFVVIALAGFGFLNYQRTRKNVAALSPMACLWIRRYNQDNYELVLEDNGKITHVSSFSNKKKLSDAIDMYCGCQISSMCLPGRGASGELPVELPGIWYKFYPHLSSVREVNKRTLEPAKWWESFIPFRTRAWSPFVFTDDAFLSTPGLTLGVLKEYFASNPACCEPPGYEEFVASRGEDNK